MLLNFLHRPSPTETSHSLLKTTVDSVLLHRIGLGTTATDVLDAFLGGIPEAAKATGHKMPYHFVVEQDGTVVQTLALKYKGLHAWKWNSRSVGVAMLGDFRREVPSPRQWRAAVTLTALLAFPQSWMIMGHDEAPEGSKNPNKECPGRLWEMARFRFDVEGVEVLQKDLNDFWCHIRY